MRTDHIFVAVGNYADKIKAKLEVIKDRLENLLGDCIILAASITMFGESSLSDRIYKRKELADYILNVWKLKCSSNWLEGITKVNIHYKIFKDILKEYGLRKQMLSHNFSRIISKSLLYETLFTVVFAPSCPLIIDPTGQLQSYLNNTIFAELKVNSLSSSSKGINAKLE